jgi:hypothetical protein
VLVQRGRDDLKDSLTSLHHLLNAQCNLTAYQHVYKKALHIHQRSHITHSQSLDEELAPLRFCEGTPWRAESAHHQVNGDQQE